MICKIFRTTVKALAPPTIWAGNCYSDNVNRRTYVYRREEYERRIIEDFEYLRAVL